MVVISHERLFWFWTYYPSPISSCLYVGLSADGVSAFDHVNCSRLLCLFRFPADLSSWTSHVPDTWPLVKHSCISLSWPLRLLLWLTVLICYSVHYVTHLVQGCMYCYGDSCYSDWLGVSSLDTSVSSQEFLFAYYISARLLFQLFTLNKDN